MWIRCIPPSKSCGVGCICCDQQEDRQSQFFQFMSEHSTLFYLKLGQMSATHFEKQSEHELWHRLGHASFQNIRDTIKCVNGLETLESLKHITCDTHVKCPSRMIGKATLEDLQKTKKVIPKLLYQINMDSISSSVKSIEGYYYSLVFVDAATGYRWIYGLKTKDEALNVVKRWYADIAD